MRFVRISVSTASISRSRPMNDVSCTGRLPSAARPDSRGRVRRREVGVSKLMHPLGAVDVFEVVDSHVVEPRASRQVIDDEIAGGLREQRSDHRGRWIEDAHTG